MTTYLEPGEKNGTERENQGVGRVMSISIKLFLA